MALLSLWALLFASEPAITHRWAVYFPLYLIFQTILVFILMALPSVPDFMGALLGVLSICR